MLAAATREEELGREAVNAGARTARHCAHGAQQISADRPGRLMPPLTPSSACGAPVSSARRWHGHFQIGMGTSKFGIGMGTSKFVKYRRTSESAAKWARNSAQETGGEACWATVAAARRARCRRAWSRGGQSCGARGVHERQLGTAGWAKRGQHSRRRESACAARRGIRRPRRGRLSSFGVRVIQTQRIYA